MGKPTEVVRFKFADGKYEYVREPGFRAHVYRHGEEWRDVTGDGFILSMIQRIEELEESLGEMEEAARQVMSGEMDVASIDVERRNARAVLNEE